MDGVQLGATVWAEVARNAGLAARLGLPVTDCPFSAADTAAPVERALAGTWVRHYLAARPPLPTEIDFEFEGD